MEPRLKCRLHACVTAVASEFVVLPTSIYRDRLAKFCRHTKLYVYMHICIPYKVIGLNIRTLLGPVPTRMRSGKPMIQITHLQHSHYSD